MDQDYFNLSVDEGRATSFELSLYPKNLVKFFKRDLILDDMSLEELV